MTEKETCMLIYRPLANSPKLSVITGSRQSCFAILSAAFFEYCFRNCFPPIDSRFRIKLLAGKHGAKGNFFDASRNSAIKIGHFVKNVRT